MTTPRHVQLTAGLVALLLGACSSSAVDTAEPDPPTTSAVAATSTTATETTTTALPSTEPTAPQVTPPESMPGDIIEFGPQRGDEIAVVGVAYDDMLNVRIAPGIGFDVIEELPPDGTAVAEGENRLLESSFWVEIGSGEGQGWVNEAYIGFPGVTRELGIDNITVPPKETAEEFGFAVAQTFASTEPASRIALVDIDGDVMTFDVLDLGDDALKGLRLTIATTEIDEGFTISGLVEQAICSRGVTADLKCV